MTTQEQKCNAIKRLTSESYTNKHNLTQYQHHRQLLGVRSDDYTCVRVGGGCGGATEVYNTVDWCGQTAVTV